MYMQNIYEGYEQMAKLFLGLDSSTQSLSALIIDADTHAVVCEQQVHFSSELAHYHTVDGVLPHEDVTLAHAPPLMWVEALDCILKKICNSGINCADIIAIAGCGQQHGSVYLNESFIPTLDALDAHKSLYQQLQNIFSRETAPIWMDASTGLQCQALAEAVGGNDRLCELTGSPAIERFTAAQIKKFADQEPLAYAASAHICLVSSFMASLLAGKHIAIDYTDATGMNLLDIRTRKWHQDLLACCGENLAQKLLPAINPCMQQGNIADYFVRRYGFAIDCRIIPWSGDNPSSLLGLGLIEEGMTAISLGTSDTCFGYMQQLPPRMSPDAHTFIAPLSTDPTESAHLTQSAYMSLLCFRNGSLAREAIRQQWGLSWAQWSAAIESTPPANNGGIMLPWVGNETVPRVSQAGVHIFDCADDVGVQCRALLEGQMMAIAIHAEQAGLHPTSIRVSGGASVNPTIVQVMADVFQCPVDLCAQSNSAALGAALRALQAHSGETWQAVLSPYTQVNLESRIHPRKQYATVYAALKCAYAAAEERVLSEMVK